MRTRIIFLFSAFWLNSAPLLAQFTPWDIIYCLNGGENKSVGISKLAGPNPLEKPGWNLIFNDEFRSDSLNPDKWNRSSPWDDGNGSCSRGFATNPINPAVEPEIARISNTLVSIIPDCPYSGGEIKTMSVADTAFRSFYFYAPGYLETRVKLFNKAGQGAACWLWGVGTPENPGTPGAWNEIDLFELNGVNSNIFNGAYHWTHNGTHVSQTHSIYLTDSAQLYDLSSNWTTFGLEWDTASIKWYVNNLLVKELDLHVIPPYCVSAPQYNQPLAPFCIRLSTGPNTVGNQSAVPDPANFPQSMLIDYVRAYKKKGEKATPVIIQDNLCQMCATDTSFASSAKIIRTPYYPGATYIWDSPAYAMAAEQSPIPQPPEKFRLWIKQGTQPGQSYPVYLQVLFPEGYTESDTAWLYIAQGPPLLPPDEFLPVPIDSLCYFSLSAHLQPNVAGGEFSIDNGLSWTRGTIRDLLGIRSCLFGNFKPGEVVQFVYRELNGCGYSPLRYSSRTIPQPSPGCTWPFAIDDSLQQHYNPKNPLVSCSPNPVTENLIVKLDPSLLADKNIIQLVMYDIHSRSLLDLPVSESVNQFKVGHLPHGLYCIVLIRNNRIIYKSTFLKN